MAGEALSRLICSEKWFENYITLTRMTILTSWKDRFQKSMRNGPCILVLTRSVKKLEVSMCFQKNVIEGKVLLIISPPASGYHMIASAHYKAYVVSVVTISSVMLIETFGRRYPTPTFCRCLIQSGGNTQIGSRDCCKLRCHVIISCNLVM